jgi:hypothetical protein
MFNKWEMLAAQAYKINRERRKLEKEYANLLTEILSDCKNEPQDGQSYQLIRSVRPGNVDYKVIPGLQFVDLDTYRKEDIVCWKIDFKGE